MKCTTPRCRLASRKALPTTAPPITPRCYLVTYAPLACNPAGRAAAEQYGIEPFVDGSIRREPDLEHPWPSISCLCRTDKFAPRLQMGDFVAYITRKNGFGLGNRHYRLTAVLNIQQVFDSHANAATWYQRCGLHLPSNCMVPVNSAKPFDQSHRIDGLDKSMSDAKRHRLWNAAYKGRAKAFGTFVVCHALFRDISWDAPSFQTEDLVAAFGKVPGTQNPGAMPADAFWTFLSSLGISVPLSSR